MIKRNGKIKTKIMEKLMNRNDNYYKDRYEKGGYALTRWEVGRKYHLHYGA